MINFFKRLFGKAETPATPEVPYKVETPVVEVPPPAPVEVVLEKAVEETVKPVAKAAKTAKPKKAGAGKPKSPRKPKAAKS